MEMDKVKMRQLNITAIIFCAGLILYRNVEAASLVTIVWLLWLIYSK